MASPKKSKAISCASSHWRTWRRRPGKRPLPSKRRQKAAAEQACLNALPLQTHTYFLNYAKAENIAPIISRMLSPRGSVVAYPARNAVIVRDIRNAEQCSR
ncbi:MAG: hypothetical protein DMG16_14480 [Acidobacteria bacterium]|nr:MAG: hypothetical protein DMG16_14480 [Acidobacteriota bacterium]